MEFEPIDEYESLPTHSVFVHLIAGAAAGIGEHCAMYPIDTVKTRMQSLCTNCPERGCSNPIKALFCLVKNEGILRSIRGMNAIAAGAIPAHAMYFTVYEKAKHWLTNGRSGYHPIAHGVAGIGATMVHDAVMNPAEVVKQRMQMFASPYQRCVECAKCVFKSEGVCAFYRSYTTQLLMNIPYHSTHFIVYETVQQWWNPHRSYNWPSHVVAGGLAGGAAAALTTPLDVIKTVLNTQEVALTAMRNGSNFGQIPTTFGSGPTLDGRCPTATRGVLSAAKVIYQLRGWTGFFSGLQARVLFQMPGTAVAWLVYETFKYGLSLNPADAATDANKSTGSHRC